MKVRYGLIRYLYSSYAHSAMFGGSIIKPFLFLFPYDTNGYKYITS